MVSIHVLEFCVPEGKTRSKSPETFCGKLGQFKTSLLLWWLILCKQNLMFFQPQQTHHSSEEYPFCIIILIMRSEQLPQMWRGQNSKQTYSFYMKDVVGKRIFMKSETRLSAHKRHLLLFTRLFLTHNLSLGVQLAERIIKTYKLVVSIQTKSI